jgi:hypothetical protein
MTTGCLAYPFASTPENRTESSVKVSASLNREQGKRPLVEHLGELSVDRIGILRALRENPLSLNIILDELMLVLEEDTEGDSEAEFEDEPYFALPMA